MSSSLKKDTILSVSFIITILLLLIITICGICSFDKTHSYQIINQYGNNVKIWGAGIYAHDSYFKAPIFIGSDLTILISVIPLAIVSFWKIKREESIEHYIRSFGVLSVLLYYSASLVFGVTYNNLHLLYIALFGICFYSVGVLFARLHTISVWHKEICAYPFTKGMKVFLLTAGIALFAAWLPDIITSIINGTSLELIEVYTTEITYVLDMGIVSPFIIITFCLLKRKNFMGYVFLRMSLQVCIVIGIMLPVQTLFQLLAGITIPLPALITKVLTFVMLALSAAFFDYYIKRETCYKDIDLHEEADKQ